MKNKKIMLMMLIVGTMTIGTGCVETEVSFTPIKAAITGTVYDIDQDTTGVWRVWFNNDSDQTVYSIGKKDTETIESIQAAHESGDKITVFYRTVESHWPWQYASNTIIYKTEPVN